VNLAQGSLPTFLRRPLGLIRGFEDALWFAGADPVRASAKPARPEPWFSQRETEDPPSKRVLIWRAESSLRRSRHPHRGCPSPKLDPTKNLTKSEAVDAPRATATKRPIQARRTDNCRAESQGRLQSCTDELSDWHGKTRAFSCHRHGSVGIAQQYVRHCYRQTERPSA
jgi:hypothetical protein